MTADRKAHNSDTIWKISVTAVLQSAYKKIRKKKLFCVLIIHHVHFIQTVHARQTLYGRCSHISMFICAFLLGVVSSEQYYIIVHHSLPDEGRFPFTCKALFALLLLNSSSDIRCRSWSQFSFWDLTDEARKAARVPKPTVLISLLLITVFKSDQIFAARLSICWINWIN